MWTGSVANDPTNTWVSWTLIKDSINTVQPISLPAYSLNQSRYRSSLSLLEVPVAPLQCAYTGENESSTMGRGSSSP